MRKAWRKVGALVDRRDLLGAAGLALLGFGGEQLMPGSGYAAAGAVMVAIAVLVR